MLKIIRSPNKSAPSRNDSNWSVSNRKNNSKSTFERNDGNSEINRFGVGSNDVEYAKKSGKLKGKKLSKS